MKKILITFAWLTVCLAGYAQSLFTVKLDSLFDRLADKNKAMGSVALMKDGKIIYARAIGFSETENKIPAGTLTKFRIGSISKVFTATMIYQLEEEGRLNTETTLDKFYPQIPNAERITIDQMLCHHSGIHSFTNDSLYGTYMTQPKTHEEMLQIIAGSQPDFEPGKKGAYSNSNFVLLGYILEQVTGKSYAELLDQRIVKRIGLQNTSYGGKTSPEKQEARSYTFFTDWIKSSETDLSIPGGAGALVSTPSDLTAFIHALFTGKLVSTASLGKMKTLTDGIGRGLFQFPFETRKAYGHTGGIDAFLSSLSYFPDEDLALAYCTNGAVYPMNDIMIGVLSIFFNKPYKIPDFEKVEVAPEQLDKYTGSYSSKDIPLKITIANKDNSLTGQATGQPAFPLEASAIHTFKFEPAGIVLVFDPENKAFTLKQGGMSFHYTMEVIP